MASWPAQMATPRGHEAAAGFGVPCLVAADVEVAGDFFCFDGVAVAVAGHAEGGDDVFIGTLFQDGVDEHGLGIGVVEGLADDLVVFQDGQHVTSSVRRTKSVRTSMKGLMSAICRARASGLALAQVADHVGLAVEIGIDGIEVDEVPEWPTPVRARYRRRRWTPGRRGRRWRRGRR